MVAATPLLYTTHMLQQFTVENFLSFKDREVFKLQPGKGSRNKEHKVEPVKGHWILNLLLYLVRMPEVRVIS